MASMTLPPAAPADPPLTSQTGKAPDLVAAVRDADGELMKVLTLLRAARDAAQAEPDVDDDNMTSSDSRITALLVMADDKVRSVILALEAAGPNHG